LTEGFGLDNIRRMNRTRRFINPRILNIESYLRVSAPAEIMVLVPSSEVALSV